jgi:hypothetical protein
MRMMLTTLYSQWDCLIQMLFDLNCMLSVGYKPETLITLNMAKIWLKVIGVSHCRQVSPLSICGLYMSRCWPLGQLVRSILLSVVTQVLLVDSLVCNWSLSLYLSIFISLSAMPMRLSVGGPDSWWLDPILGPILGVGYQWRSSPLRRGVFPCNCQENASMQSSIFCKPLPLLFKFKT